MSRVLREVVPPLVAVYALVLAMLAAIRKGWPPRETRRPLREIAVTIVLGYACFLLIVLVFMTLATGDRTALPEAVWEGAALLGIAIPAFVVLSAIEVWRRAR